MIKKKAVVTDTADGPKDVFMTGNESAALITLLMLCNLTAKTLQDQMDRQGYGSGVALLENLRSDIIGMIDVIGHRQCGEVNNVLTITGAEGDSKVVGNDEAELYGFTNTKSVH